MRNFQVLFVLILCSLAIACGKGEDPPGAGGPPTANPGIQTARELWATSPVAMTSQRGDALDALQGYADLCSSTYFAAYLKSLDAACESMERHDPVLAVYRAAFDRVLKGIRSDQVESGTVEIWMLYNMGYVVKTPSVCFGVDLMHRWAEQLAPYLDFMCVTHNHQDHYSSELIQVMFDAGKPVLSNYLRKGANYAYTSTSPNTYTIKGINIRTAITDHNSSTKNFVTVFRFDCGAETDHFTLVHTGDSNYLPAQFTSVEGPADVLIPRYAPNALEENRIFGNGSGQITPRYVLLSHILELSHVDVAGSRWTVGLALDRASKLHCDNTYVPMWGEKLIWKNDRLN